ncbi:MAG: hypothetical protein ABFS18_01515 [Thermodesulfobacteriota bacterium]
MFRIILLSFYVVIILCCPSHALENPSYPIESVDNKTLIIESAYNYDVRLYKQPLSVDFIEKINVDFSSPEKTLLSILSGMKNKDISWVLDCYDSESKLELESIISSQQSSQALIDKWNEIYTGSTIYLLRWIDTEKMIIIEYSVKKEDGTEKKNNLNFRKIDNFWKATNIYSDYPVSNYLDEDRVVLHGE